MRELGAEPSFAVIVAGAANGAQPHAEPGEREIGAGELVVFDMGALIDGYCSDCTRTHATGDVADEARDVSRSFAARQAALDAVRPGMTGRELDAIPREIISDAGHGDRFGHGIGHGVGLEVHERRRSGDHVRRRAQRPATWSRSSPGSTWPGGSGFGSRTSSRSPPTATTTSIERPKELEVVE